MPVANQLTLLQNFENAPIFVSNNTRYGGGQGASQNNDIVRSGNNSGGRRADNTATGGFGVVIPTTDMSAAGYVVKIWVSITQWSALNSLGITVASGSGGTAGDAHTVPTSLWPENFGFIPVWIDVGRIPENGANAVLTAINEIGIQVNIGDVGGNAQNIIGDDIHGGIGGLIWTGAGGSFQDFRDFENLTPVGLFQREQSGDVCYHRLIIAGSFTDNDFNITFPDNGLTGSTSMGLTIDLDTGPGPIDLSGGSLRSANVASATNRPDLLVIGSFNAFQLPSCEGFRLIQMVSNATAEGVVLDALEIQQNGGIISSSIIRSRTAAGVALINDPLFANLNGNTFIQAGSGHAIQASANGVNININNEIQGYGADDTDSAFLLYTGTDPIEVTYTGSTRPTVNPTSLVTVLDAQVPIDITVLDNSTGLPIENARIEFRRSSDKSQFIPPLETDAAGKATTTVSFSSNVAIEGWVRQHDLLGIDYSPENYIGTVTASGFILIIRLNPI